MIKDKNILQLTINQKWFNEILNEVKKEEYREVKNYWVKRLTNQNNDGTINGNSFYKPFKYVLFRNGYKKNAPWLLVEFKGVEIKEIEHEHFNNEKIEVFAIKLGKIRNGGNFNVVLNIGLS